MIMWLRLLYDYVLRLLVITSHWLLDVSAWRYEKSGLCCICWFARVCNNECPELSFKRNGDGDAFKGFLELGTGHCAMQGTMERLKERYVWQYPRVCLFLLLPPMSARVSSHEKIREESAFVFLGRFRVVGWQKLQCARNRALYRVG